jgi:hypothetical protein
MARITLPWTYHSNSGRSRVATLERLINLYPESSNSILASNSDATDVMLLSAPGCRPYSLVSDGTDVVHLHSTGDNLYAWSREGLYKDRGGFRKIFSANIGKRVIAAHGERDNGIIDLWWTDGARSYILNTQTGTVHPLDDDNSFLPAGSTTYLDGYALFSRRNTNEFFWSDIQDYDEFQGLSFAAAEGFPDDLLRIIAFERELWLFGKQTLEIWQNTGDANSPFVRLGNAFIETGCANPYTIVKLTRDMYWVSDDLRVMKSAARSYRPEPISLHQGVEHDLNTYGVEDAFAFAVTMEGHSFYWLTLPKADRTWIYDEDTGFWHERSSNEQCGPTCENNSFGRHFANSGVMHKNQAYIGGTGEVYTADLDYFLDGEENIWRMAQTAPIRYAADEMVFNKVELEFQNSCGFLDSDCGDPGDVAVNLDWTDDLGKTWCEGSPRWLTDDSNNIPAWNNLGRSRARSFRWSTRYPGQIAFLRSIMYVDGVNQRGN